MSDPRNTIQKKFSDQNRYGAYGDVLMRIRAQGFRCHSDTLIEVKSPITAFCGLNGTGKSTLLQLAATAFRKVPQSGVDHFRISDFMVMGTLDPSPFRADTRVEYRYWQSDRKFQITTLSYRQVSRRWQGYPRRPPRLVFFTGAGHYLPRIEQRDFVVRHAQRLKLLSNEPVPAEVQEWTARILGQSYDVITTNRVDYVRQARHREADVVSVARNGAEYSEAHMGFGEGRTIYLVSALEKLPERSLILIEEPETSLHPSAQYQLGQYLVDVVNRKHHQIFLTSHSMFLLSALPLASVVYLKRVDIGIDPVTDLSAIEVHSLLADGHVKALHVLVEDECAKSILREILRHGDPDFLRVVDIHVGGDAKTLATTVRSLKETRIPIACVRDGDTEGSPSDNIFKLPGTQAPEKELFNDAGVVACLKETYHVELSDFRTTLADTDHHVWISRLADHVNTTHDSLLSELARAYTRSIPENEISRIVSQLKEAVRA